MSGWIAVDLDGTLAEYHGWKGEDHIGSPIPAMAAKVREWLIQGKEVRIFTARICRNAAANRKRIQAWTKEHFGVRLKVTNRKDYGMVQLWDDRAVRVVENEGRPCCRHFKE